MVGPKWNVVCKMKNKKSSDQHWCRIIMDQSTKRMIENLNHKDLEVLEISGKSWEKFEFKKYSNVHYPTFDLCHDFIESNIYDLIIVEQVLEHVADPKKAIQNIKKLLKNNGHVLITLPFMIKIHGDPNDYWRWTPNGLRLLLETLNFSIINLESWGNRECLVANIDTWQIYKEGDNLQNEPEIPLVVWCLAKND